MKVDRGEVAAGVGEVKLNLFGGKFAGRGVAYQVCLRGHGTVESAVESAGMDTGGLGSGEHARVLPIIETIIEVVDGAEMIVLEDGQCLGAAAATSAMQDLGLILIELSKLLSEICCLKINIQGTRNMALSIFLWGSDIKDP